MNGRDSRFFAILYRAKCCCAVFVDIYSACPMVVQLADKYFSVSQEAFLCSGCTWEHPNFLTEILSLCRKEDENICVAAQHVTFVITPNSCILAIVQFVCLHPCDLKTAAADSLQTHRTTTHSVSLWTLRYPPAHVQDVSYSIVTFQSTENGQNWSCFLQRQ